MASHRLVAPPAHLQTHTRVTPDSGRPLTTSIAVAVAELADVDLISLVSADDPAGLSGLYDRHGPAAFGLALRITRDPSLAEDVVQDAFLGVWRNAQRYDATRGGVRTWIMAIVHHRSVDLVRKRRPVSELSTDGSLPAGLVQPDIWAEIAGILDRDTVARALETLGSAQRQVIEMAYFSGLTQMEIARRTGAPLGTVKSRARLGLLALRAAITFEYPRGQRPATAGQPRASVGGPG